MIARRLVSALRQRCCRLAADGRGVSAIEFALLMPLMLTMYFGSIEVTDAISADRRGTLVASTVADITSEYTAVASADVTNILAAACAVLAPFPTANATVTLSSVTFDGSGNATVAWSFIPNATCTSFSTGRTVGSVVTNMIPAALRVPNTSVIWGECTYQYKPVIGYVITGTLSMYNQMFMVPRLSTSVTYTG